MRGKMSTGQYGRLYNGLDGRELRRKIIRDIEDLLDQDDRFSQNVVYPKVSFTFDLSIKVYPREPEEIRLQIGREYGEGGSGNGVERVYHGEHEHQHPDKVRQAIDVPIPTPQKVKRVGVVDVTREQQEEIIAKRETEVGLRSEYVPEVSEPLIIPATEIPSDLPKAAKPANAPRETVEVRTSTGTRRETVEIEGHATAPRPIEIPRSPAVRKSIANDAAMDDGWAEQNLGARPVYVESKVPNV